MPKITINGREIEVEDGLTIIQACEQIGIDIPRFCYHEKLAIAGNCRMCLVEVEKMPKLAASCAQPVAEGMIIHTDNAKVKKAREGVMEFLLANHPLDCPVCDQGGECDLQDQALYFGRGEGRFEENKRAVKDKNMGPLIKTHMTRCIHCTRCIRFATDIAGVSELGAIGRGEHMEITTYLEQTLSSELSGNVIDLCPVGALTSKPYAFKCRSWELEKVESVDVLDAVGSNIRVDYRGLEVMRILPLINEEVNEEWISDKARFSYDGLKNQRLDRPYIRKEDGKLKEASWEEAFELVAKKLRSTAPEKMGAIVGDLSDCESIFVLKQLFNNLGCNNLDFNQRNFYFDKSARGNYLFNTTISRVEEADFCLLVGAYPRRNAALINTRLRKAWLEKGLKIYRVGTSDDDLYKVIELGTEPDALKALLDGKSAVANAIKSAKKPMIIIGDAALVREDAKEILATIHKIVEKFDIVRDDWNGFNILHNYASNIGALDLGFYPQEGSLSATDMVEQASKGQMEVLFLHGADEIDVDKLKNTFVIYQGHHGDKAANIADIILPAAAYTEKDAIYINTEGRAQLGRKAVNPVGQAKDDREILLHIAKLLKIKLGFESLQDIRTAMANKAGAFKSIGQVLKNDFKLHSGSGNMTKEPIRKLDINFYMTDPISRASKTMAECVKAMRVKESA